MEEKNFIQVLYTSVECVHAYHKLETGKKMTQCYNNKSLSIFFTHDT